MGRKDSKTVNYSSKAWVLALFVICLLVIGLFVKHWYQSKMELARIMAPNPIRPTGFPEYLYVPEEAQDIDYYHSTAVNYQIAEPYPADSIIHHIQSKLSDAGFTATGTPSRQWSYLNEGLSRIPGKSMHEWMQNWTNFHDRTVLVVLQYIVGNYDENDRELLGVVLQEMPINK